MFYSCFIHVLFMFYSCSWNLVDLPSNDSNYLQSNGLCRAPAIKAQPASPMFAQALALNHWTDAGCLTTGGVLKWGYPQIIHLGGGNFRKPPTGVGVWTWIKVAVKYSQTDPNSQNLEKTGLQIWVWFCSSETHKSQPAKSPNSALANTDDVAKHVQASSEQRII